MIPSIRNFLMKIIEKVLQQGWQYLFGKKKQYEYCTIDITEFVLNLIFYINQ